MMDSMSDIRKVRQALRSIVNLVSFKVPDDLREACSRLNLIRATCLEMLDVVDEIERETAKNPVIIRDHRPH